MKVKSLIGNIITIIIIFIVSFGIWYLVDTQLTDKVTFEIPVIVKLPSTLELDWAIVEQSHEKIEVQFEGPKDVINGIKQQQKEIQAFIRINPDELRAKGAVEFEIHRTAGQISYETEAGPVPEALKEILIDINKVSCKVAKTVNTEIMLLNEDIIKSFEDLPDPQEYDFELKNIEPERVFIKAPVIYSVPKSLKFNKLSLVNIQGRGIETREYTRRLRFASVRKQSSIKFFADRELKQQIDVVEVTFGFDYKNIVERTFKNVPVQLVLPSWCVKEKITIDQLPGGLSDDKTKFPELTLKGRADALQALNDGDVMLLFVILESDIDKDTLIESKKIICSSTKYQLYINPKAFEDEEELQGSTFEIVSTGESLTRIEC